MSNEDRSGGYISSHDRRVQANIDDMRDEAKRLRSWASDITTRIVSLVSRYGKSRFTAMIQQWDAEQGKNLEGQFSLGRMVFMRIADKDAPATLGEAYASLTAFHDYFVSACKISPIPFIYGNIADAGKAAESGRLHLFALLASYGLNRCFVCPQFGEADIENFLSDVKADLKTSAPDPAEAEETAGDMSKPRNYYESLKTWVYAHTILVAIVAIVTVLTALCALLNEIFDIWSFLYRSR